MIPATLTRVTLYCGTFPHIEKGDISTPLWTGTTLSIHLYLERLVHLNCFLQQSKGSIALRLFKGQIIYKMDILSSLKNIFMRSSGFPWYPTLLVTFINAFTANRRWSSPKALISVFPENIDFFYMIQGEGKG